MNLREQMAALKADMKAIVERAKAESRDLTTDEATEIEAKATEFEKFDHQLKAHEKAQKLVGDLTADDVAREPADDERKSRKSVFATGGVGKGFTDSEGFKSFRKANPGGVSNGTPIHIEAKGVGSVQDLGIGRKELTSATGELRNEREPGYRNYLPVDEPITFLNLVTTASSDVAYSEYAQIIAETNNAAIVPEGEEKPLSDLETATAESKAYVYADGFVVTNQSLADDGALAAFMETRIRQHVRGVIEQKLFNGAGAGTEPTGIMNTTGTLAQAFDSDVITTISRAMETFESNNGNSNVQAIVMNPRDIWNLRLLREAGATGGYLLGNPLQQGSTPTPWGVPLVPSNKLAQGQALVGRFDSVHYLELDPLNVLAFNQHADFARRNKVYVRAESRGRQLFYAPREVVVASLATAG